MKCVLPFLIAAGVLAGCAIAPPTPPSEAPPAPAPPVAAEEPATDVLGVLAYAASLKGMPYRSGGSSPQAGFDCSGLVQHVFGQLGVSLPRGAQEMAKGLPPVDTDDRRPGDLLFFNTTGTAHSHVGIYLGDDEFVHAPSNDRTGVIISNLRQPYWRGRLDAVRRPPLPRKGLPEIRR